MTIGGMYVAGYLRKMAECGMKKQAFRIPPAFYNALARSLPYLKMTGATAAGYGAAAIPATYTINAVRDERDRYSRALVRAHNTLADTDKTLTAMRDQIRSLGGADPAPAAPSQDEPAPSQDEPVTSGGGSGIGKTLSGLADRGKKTLSGLADRVKSTDVGTAALYAAGAGAAGYGIYQLVQAIRERNAGRKSKKR